MNKSLILKKIKEHYNFKTDSDFANFLGITSQVLSNWKSRNSYDAELIYTKCLEINPEWLLTGKEPMLKENVLHKPIDNEEKGYPLVNVTAIGGSGNSVFSFTNRDVKAYYKIPKFSHKKVDFMIEVEGSSMYPKYNSGDVVACTIIKDSAFIQWNKTHVIATEEQGIIIKRIKRGTNEGFLTMISDNNSYDPFEVPKAEITGIALVVGVIRLE